jgi:hypothetical protein
MIISKLLKGPSSSFEVYQLYGLVDGFISGLDVEECVKRNIGVAEGEQLIKENLEIMEDVMFNCLVAYRMVLSP